MNEEMLMQLLAMLEQGQVGTGAGDSSIEALLREVEGGRQNVDKLSRGSREGRNRRQSGSQMSEQELMQMLQLLEQGR